jgi:uncharacterized protein (DUF488 family)
MEHNLNKIMQTQKKMKNQ